MPADDLTDPAPATTFSHLDGTLVLSRQIAELGIYPAVDPLDSTSRILDPNVVGEEHYGVARGVQQVLQKYKELQTSSPSSVWTNCPTTTSLSWLVRVASSVSCRSLSMCRNLYRHSRRLCEAGSHGQGFQGHSERRL